ncbi:DegT/DnrJ/EryC1/StrS family aminotransferase [Citrifermentans bremense]|uniref:DegT/DnrJ/EryC1/StrS family aminotransferase n=1 Tax=Citrifermentans bremense TaxID=60035 RepID=UPI000402C892|nr:DegT/DnrJ/EryC1/StrS family aminotransferase [Citrifermentans bremense]
MKAKNTVDELGIFTGKPIFNEAQVVGRPNVGNSEDFLARVNDILERRWFTNNGKYVQEFEKRMAEYIGVKHCIAMCNATVALEIAIRGVGMTGEVIVPSFTFVATPHSLQWQQITPVFCDIDPTTHNLDPLCVEKMITPRTTGILAVHVWGRPCAIEELTAIANRRGLKLIFDAAHAFACSHKGQMIGSFGDAEVFSFHATKFFNTFEGGAVATNDDDLAVKIRRMKNFGFAGYDNVDYIGTNGKMSEMSAAMGLTSLEGLEGFIDVNRRNYELYRERLAGLRGVRLIDYDGAEKCNYQYIVAEIDEDLAGVSRDQLVDVLHKENVLARRYFYPGCHQMEPYCSYFPHAGLLLPNTERLADRVMSLPNGTSVGPAAIDAICGVIRLAVTNGKKLRHMLQVQG